MDEHTLEKLEYDRIRVLLSEHAQCALGRSLALRLRPSKRFLQVSRWLEQAEQFGKWVDRHGLPPFGGITDVRPQVRRAVPPAKLEPFEFADLASAIQGIGMVRSYFAGLDEGFEAIAGIVARIGELRFIADRINLVIDPRGRVRDDATERLRNIRSEIDGVRQRTKQVFDRLTRKPDIVKYLQYANATFHDDRMVLPVKADQRGRVPGIVHRSSDSGQTLFVEPAEAVELNNRLVGLLQTEQEEINRILWELTHLVHLNQTELLNTLDTVAVVDLLAAKIKFARRYQMHLPKVTQERQLVLRQARNPVLMAMYEGAAAGSTEPTSQSTDHADHRVVPIDVRLGDDFDIMLITGPNTGGKTATLKTVGLLTLMSQSGLPIPAAAGATVPLFQGIWIDVGDEQSLQQSLSTFSGHLARILDILRRTQGSTLVLLDELGAGTDPDEGAAIGKAIVDHLLSRGCLAIVTTHLGALKAMGFENRRVDNASVQFDAQTLQPTYELRIGEPGNSNAIAIASRLGMPKALIRAARQHLTGRQRALQKAIAGTLTARRAAERARRDAEQARQQAARQTLAALDQAKALEDKHRNYAAWVERIMKLQPGDAVRVHKFDDPARILRVHLDKQRATVDIGAKQLEVSLSDLRFDEDKQSPKT
jgi:DNA mismatch repair protein MutS2